MVVVECRARVRLGGRDFFQPDSCARKLARAPCGSRSEAFGRSTPRSRRDPKSSYSSRQTGRVLASTRWNRYHRTSVARRATRERRSRVVSRTSARSAHFTRSPRRGRRPPRLSSSARPCRARPRRECVSGGSITASPICACRVADPRPRALLARRRLRPLPVPRSPRTPRARPRPTLATALRVSCATARAPFAAVNSRIPRAEARNIVKLRPARTSPPSCPGRVRRPRQRILAPPPARPRASSRRVRPRARTTTRPSRPRP